jgi:hypothetical protein
MALDDDLRAIQARIATLTSKKTRAEVERDNADAKVAEARTALEEEFGVKTTAEAKAKLAELEQNLRDVVAEVEAELEAAGA